MSSLALYRTYRPGQFADVVGQEHVTVPLMRALAADRVHHAYLFSGPRGCGKTSSARILARSLNCEKGPTPEPCGECQSCRDLAPNGPGNIDVVELDAATHGLVDDARELREKAHFAPVSSRFKIYIIDEAHQLGPGAANALLKLIEEPPAHVKFIFATTAPDKIIGTIRSRTHHYPFRLIPTKVLQQNLTSICEKEGVPIEPAAVALVARAGAGSARDAQSVLGQLIAGAGDEGVTYELAVALLGFTDAALLDQVVEAIAAGDGPSVYSAVDQVMDSGHDPRRFLTDLLERFRDLVVLRAVPDAAASGLLDLPPDQATRMATQASQFGPHDLIRLADVVDEGITAMKGATPTRLQLELVCARLLLPGADDSIGGIQARLDRLERRLAGGVPTAVAAPSVPTPRAAAHDDAEVRRIPSAETAATHEAAVSPDVAVELGVESPVADRPPRNEPSDGTPPPASIEPTQPAGPAEPAGATGPAVAPTPVEPSAPAAPPTSVEPSAPPVEPSAVPTGSVADVRRMWPEVLVRLKEIKRTPWSLISQESMVSDVSGGVLTLAFRQPTLRDTFARRDDFQQCLRQAIKDVLLLDLKIEAIVDPSVDPSSQPARASAGLAGGSAASAMPVGGAAGPAESTAPAAVASPASAEAATAEAAGDAEPQRPSARVEAAERVRQDAAPAAPAPVPRRVVADDDADPDDDADLDDSGLTERELLERTLGATVIKEIEHD